jgi:triacylglycerol lipase
MIARGLRFGLAVQIFAAALFAYGLANTCTLSAPLAALLGFAALLAVYAGLTLLTFALTWPRRGEAAPEQRIGFLPGCLMICREWLAFFALFAIVQPFGDSFFSVKQARRRSDDPPVVLVHGYKCNSAFWWWMIARLRSAGIAAEAIDLEPALASIDSYADQLHRQIEACVDETGAGKVRLITHSMGGLVARAYLNRYGSARVDRAITLACVHHGTRLARLGFGPNARQMEPGSAWLSGLPGRLPVPAVNVWMAQDNFIAPQTSSRLPGSEDIMLSGMGHLTIAFSPLVADLLVKKLRSF